MALKNPNDPFFPDGLPEAAAPASGAGVPAVAGEGRRRTNLPALTSAPDPVALLRALRRHWLLALVLGAVGAVSTGVAAWKFLPQPKYTATVLVEVKTQKPVLLVETNQEKIDYRIFQSTQLTLVKSRLVLTAALGRPGIAELPTVRAQQNPSEWLEEQLTVEFLAGSELMKLTLSGERPSDLTALVNAMADSYLDEILTKDHNERSAASAELKRLLGKYNDKLTKQRAELRKLAETVGSDDKQMLAMKQQFALRQLESEKLDLQKTQSDLKHASAELAVLRSGGR